MHIDGQFSINRKYLGNRSQSLTTEKIQIEKADRIVKMVKEENPNSKIYAKLGCEGAEYGILKLLDKENLLKEIDLIMMEWHDKGPTELLEILRKNNFVSYSFWPNNKDIGMVYSFQKAE